MAPLGARPWERLQGTVKVWGCCNGESGAVNRGGTTVGRVGVLMGGLNGVAKGLMVLGILMGEIPKMAGGETDRGGDDLK